MTLTARDAEGMMKRTYGKERSMPAKTEQQRRFFGAELARKRSGAHTLTDMSEDQMKEFAKRTDSPRGRAIQTMLAERQAGAGKGRGKKAKKGKRRSPPSAPPPPPAY